MGRGGHRAGNPLPPLYAIAFVLLSPTPRSAGGERDKPGTHGQDAPDVTPARTSRLR